ncbi:pyridoxamine 5'-phosphate oxidase family protein [Janthinobacterium sp. SUN118]|uniref:pyridoxamine 5'-phosphate oxidase family protein n=1 Tax=Janthinobacterium sp. SUN118 TaxID=3004100 RepID=UPI0025B11732|nr:pyridoxamine 5'-phosphate oxidase family protein [Janthinobacterium sp. SUN118]MDN2708880.1 pyridoxamine 5'-phosphate oxidase family protein [Janthinobacterium sp. SUN118]
MPQYSSEQLASIADKIKSVKFGMLTTSDDTRTLTSRPLTQQQVDGEGRIWFFVSDEAAYTRDLLNNPQVNVSFVDTGDSLYVSVCGHAELLKDRAKAEELWSPLVKAWFPGGLDDPKLSLIKVTIQSAEYWDSSASKMTQFFEMAKAAITGETPKDLGEHGRIDL